MTTIARGEGVDMDGSPFIYLSAVIDLYTRKIVGLSLSESLTHDFRLESMRIAVTKEKPPIGVIHHSDR
jgi:putative transposase